MKKSRALKIWSLIGWIGTIFAIIYTVVFTVVAVFGNTNLSRAIVWAPTFNNYFGALVTAISKELWFMAPAYLPYSIAWVGLIVVTVGIAVTLFVLGGVKKCKHLVGIAFEELGIGLLLDYLFLLFYFGNYNPSGAPHIASAIMPALFFGTGNFGETIAFYIYCAFFLAAIVGYIGLFVAGLTHKCEEVEEVEEEAVRADNEEEKEPVAIEGEKRRGILLLRPYARRVQPQPQPQCEVVHEKPLSAEEIRKIMREELERRENEKIIEEYKQQKQAEAVAAAILKAQAKEKPCVCEAPKHEPEEEGLSEDEVKSIISEEIRNALKDFVVRVHQEVKIKEIPVEEEKAEEVPAIEAVVEEEPVEAKEEPKEEPVAEPVVEEAAVADEIAQPMEPRPVIIRVPFTKRIEDADPEIKAAFNQLKSLLKAYGLNDRVSNGGDSFRLHRVTYCKITVAGKSLKLYLALDPKDYLDTKLPIKDASSKAMYQETPLVFKVRSGLSLRRAEELIRDCMVKHGIEQADRVQEFDWVSELRNAEVDTEVVDDDEE